MEDFEWNVVNEGQLLEAMVGHKPVGVNKYFQMACICEKFAENCQKDIESEKIWKHLQTMYNLEVLDESEVIPFPNIEKEFTLPESEFGQLIAKRDEERKNTSKGRETPKSLKEVKKDEKTTNSAKKETPRRDSKDSKDRATSSAKKEPQETNNRSKAKGKSVNTPNEKKTSRDDTPKPKRPLRNSSIKADDSGSSGKSSPVSVTPNPKRRRI